MLPRQLCSRKSATTSKLQIISPTNKVRIIPAEDVSPDCFSATCIKSLVVVYCPCNKYFAAEQSDTFDWLKDEKLKK